MPDDTVSAYSTKIAMHICREQCSYDTLHVIRAYEDRMQSKPAPKLCPAWASSNYDVL